MNGAQFGRLSHKCPFNPSQSWTTTDLRGEKENSAVAITLGRNGKITMLI